MMMAAIMIAENKVCAHLS